MVGSPVNNPPTTPPPFKVGEIVLHKDSDPHTSRYTITKVFWDHPYCWRVDVLDPHNVPVAGIIATVFQPSDQELEPRSWWESISE